MLTSLNHITLATKNIEESLSFYVNILGFKAHVKWDRGAHLTLGELWLCLSFDEPTSKRDYTHIAFSIEESDFDSIKSLVKEKNIKQWKQNSSEGDSLYILDPSENQLELHIGSLQSRLEYIKSKPYKNTVWL
jgi:catechol 2,3-dioxygenase-like lactoylglutathione lyase family enzyme